MKGLFIRVNPNPRGKSVGDCTIRAISIALNQSWDLTYWGICKQGFIMCDMPSANHVWGEYLETKGFVRSPIREGEDFTVSDFCHAFPHGTFILACVSHVVAVVDGHYYDTWDSGGNSRDGDVADMLREMMNGADEREREAIKRCLKEIGE